ncbi:gustatory receptor for sugar taste 64a-like isoform X1 [Arctopsyche grandis]|uniref:gustatory receptor for sugar taste 64a-like isoform X1 n=1 Tax=Arctopsyche grandis TaxID=121162 RepID=UPI00406D8D18
MSKMQKMSKMRLSKNLNDKLAKIQTLNFKSTQVNDEKIVKKISNNESFQSSMKNTLSVAYAVGLFPIKGIRENQAIALSYNKLSVPSFLSLFTILTLLWAAILSLVHTIRSLLKVNSGKSGGFANATAGGIFYSNAFVSSCIFRKLASTWPNIMIQWEKHEKDAYPYPKLRARTRAIAIIILILALTEHMLSIGINTPTCRANILLGNSTLRECLKEYCLRSHSFIFNAVQYNMALGLFIFYVSKVATFAWNFQDLFLILTCSGLVAKYRNINNKILKTDIAASNIKDWRFMRELYTNCSELARDFSSMLGPLVLLSFTNNLYFICLQMLNGLAPSLQGPLHNAYFFGSFGFMVGRLICVALAAAAVPIEARRSLPFLRCCPASTYCLEIQRLGFQLTHDEVGLTGMGFFTVNRNFMLGVAGAVATYEVVLLQFDMGQTPPPTLTE